VFVGPVRWRVTMRSCSLTVIDLIHAPGIASVAFLLAFLAGAGHAVAPGHGKTLAAAYLAGSRGRIRDAALLGGSVAAVVLTGSAPSSSSQPTESGYVAAFAASAAVTALAVPRRPPGAVAV
jgi:hypothetical protein